MWQFSDQKKRSGCTATHLFIKAASLFIAKIIFNLIINLDPGFAEKFTQFQFVKKQQQKTVVKFSVCYRINRSKLFVI